MSALKPIRVGGAPNILAPRDGQVSVGALSDVAAALAEANQVAIRDVLDYIHYVSDQQKATLVDVVEQVNARLGEQKAGLNAVVTQVNQAFAAQGAETQLLVAKAARSILTIASITGEPDAAKASTQTAASVLRAIKDLLADLPTDAERAKVIEGLSSAIGTASKRERGRRASRATQDGRGRSRPIVEPAT